MTRMKHVIRVSDSTFKELTKRANWSDTMNDVISKLLEMHKHQEEDELS
jgi:predicted CopG family antitoxin